MSNKYDEPPAYTAGGPQQPQAAYQGYQQAGYAQGPPPGGYYQQGPPPQGYYAGPQMGYQQQGPYQQGPYGQPGYPPPGGYYQQGGYYQNQRGSNMGCMEALLASLACCCCLDCLLF